MKKLFLPLAIFAMLALLAAAVCFDCDRLASDARRRVALADQEVRKQEDRLIKLLNGSPKISPEVQAALSNYSSVGSSPIDKTGPGSISGPYQNLATRQARRDAYDAILAGFRKTMSTQIDPTNQLDRAFVDDVAGAINRREIAEKQYDEESAAYKNFLNSWRGRIAQLFSSQAQSDSNQSP